jgi:CheY-like chemotaxis protein
VGKRVLVVDDNAMVRQATCSLVGSWGMFPSAVASGKEALDRLEQGEPFDLALLDVQMPDMDGLELAMEIRKRRGPDVLPLAMMTSVGLRGEKLKSARVNCQAVVTKPLRLGRLYEALMGVFGAQDAREAGASSRWTAIPRIAERHPLRVLLAEDNPMNQKLVLRLLEKMGYKADLARDGLQVLEALAERPYDVILMDVQMPELDGLEVTRRIRTALPEEARPRIVAMTAAALPADREACREAGMDDYLAKPLKVDDLVAVLATSIPRGSCRD